MGSIGFGKYLGCWQQILERLCDPALLQGCVGSWIWQKLF